MYMSLIICFCLAMALISLLLLGVCSMLVINENTATMALISLLLLGVCSMLVINENTATNYNFKPRFVQNTLTLQVHENCSSDESLFEISDIVRDDEGDDLFYELDSTGLEICTIGQHTGLLRLKKSPDREVQSRYNFKVFVRDNYMGNVKRFSVLDVYLYIEDENDNRPLFTENVYVVYIREDIAGGTDIIRVSASDDDAGRNKEIRYSFRKDMNYKDFQINPNTGVISVVGKLDHEATMTHTLIVVARDEGAHHLATSTNVIVNVVDVGDKRPHFISRYFHEDIDENLPQGTVVAAVYAIDGDKTTRNMINYEIMSGNKFGLFVIDQQSGEISVRGMIDRELYSVFNITAKAYEVGQETSYDTVNVRIKIMDKNDNRPMFQQETYHITLREGDIHPNVVISNDIKANDRDATWTNSRLYYWLDDEEYFKVIRQTGTLILSRDVRNQALNELSFVMYATEAETNEHYTACTNITVHIIRAPRRQINKLLDISASSTLTPLVELVILTLIYLFWKS